MTNLKIFQQALSASEQALQRYPSMFPLESVVAQLRYLVALTSGAISDRSGLATLDFGQIAARDIDTFDSDLADLLHDASAAANSLAAQA